MQPLLVESTVRATLIAAVIALVLYVMRIKTASARHAAWASVVVVMMLLPAWVAWGPKASLPVLAPAAERAPIAIPIANVPTVARVATHSTSAETQPSAWNWPTFLLDAYLVGVCVLLIRLAIGTVRANRLKSASCVVPVTVGFLRPRVILPEGSRGWPQAQLDAVLIHEGEHARRRDPLFQWIALLNRAIFWFHPLAWWLERRLSGLAEEACDTAVLARGHDPRDYSEYLLGLARSVERAGARIDAPGMAMPGAFLPQRIRRMLSGHPAPPVSGRRMLCTAAVCAVAAAILAAGTLVRAQSKAQAGPVFEVASVKPNGTAAGDGGFKKNKDGGNGGKAGGLTLGLDHKRFAYTATLFELIVRAYGVQDCTAPGFRIFNQECVLLSGGPAWLKKDRFDIQAKMPDNSPDYTMTQFLDGHAPQFQRMLQALLEDRFRLKVHRETKQGSVYALTVVKKGPKLKAASEEEGLGPMFQPSAQPNGQTTIKMTVKARSMQDLAETFSNMLFQPVLDRTGLQGKFDFTTEYEMDPDTPDTPSTPPAARLTGPAFFSALQQDVGLELESTKGPVQVLVIDYAEQPSPN